MATLAACIPVMLFVTGGKIPSIQTAMASIKGSWLWLTAPALLEHPTWRELRRAARGLRLMLSRLAET